MTLLESIKAVRESAGLVEGQVPYINEAVADDWNAMLAAITAAESAAAAQDAAYQRAREAWDIFQSTCNCEDDMETVCRHRMMWDEAEDKLRAYFRGADALLAELEKEVKP